MNSKTISAVIYSWLLILVIMLFGSLLISFLIKYTSFQDTSFSTMTLTISFAALFIGGLIAGIRNKEKGWLAGGLVGTGFSLFIFIIQFLGYHQGFSTEQSIVHLGFILLATLGGMIGVNIFTRTS